MDALLNRWSGLREELLGKLETLSGDLDPLTASAVGMNRLRVGG